MAGEALPTSLTTEPRLGHRHPERFPTVRRGDIVGDDAAQDGDIVDDSDIDILEPLTMPSRGAAGVGVKIGRPVEGRSLVGGPDELRVEQRLKCVPVAAAERICPPPRRCEHLTRVFNASILTPRVRV